MYTNSNQHMFYCNILLQTVLAAFSIKCQEYQLQSIGATNTTYRVMGTDGAEYIIQHINTDAIIDPEETQRKLLLLSQYYSERSHGAFPSVIRTIDNLPFLNYSGQYWRCFTYIPNSYIIGRNARQSEFFEVGNQLGHFHSIFADFPKHQLPQPVSQSKQIRSLIDFIDSKLKDAACTERLLHMLYKSLLMGKNALYGICNSIDSADLPVRVVHNDSHLGNILLDTKTHKGICMIDLDTVANGSIIYDFAEASRDLLQMLSGIADEEKLLAFRSFCDGYAAAFACKITQNEIAHLFNGMVSSAYQSGIKALADYLDNAENNTADCATRFLYKASVHFSYARFLTGSKSDVCSEINAAFTGKRGTTECQK